MDVSGWPEVFRGSDALAAGLVTRGQLRGRSFARLYPDVYWRGGDEPPDLAVRSLGAARLVDGRGVVSGYSAAELLGASCAPPNAPAEVTVRGRVRAHPGLLVHRDVLDPTEVRPIGDALATTPIRTAYDLARRLDLVDAVVAVDRLANVGRFSPDLLLHLANRYPGARGNAGLAEVLAYADYRSGSPMESRLRMVMTCAGLPRPEVQWVVQDAATRTAIWLDLAYPQHRIGVEYEGAQHAEPDAVLRDAGRYTRLVDRGWRIFRYTKLDILHDQPRIVAELTRALADERHTAVLPAPWIAQYAAARRAHRSR